MKSESDKTPIKQICCCGDELFVLREAGTVEIYGNYHERHKTVSRWKDITHICFSEGTGIGLKKKWKLMSVQKSLKIIGLIEEELNILFL